MFKRIKSIAILVLFVSNVLLMAVNGFNWIAAGAVTLAGIVLTLEIAEGVRNGKKSV